jgi:hypothetical protein
MNDLINKENIIIFIYTYLFLGLFIISVEYKINNNYIFLILFFVFKWIFNYRKCTFSRIECILRNVKKEKGYLYNILEIITDLRTSHHIIIFITIICIILYFHYIVNKSPLFI